MEMFQAKGVTLLIPLQSRYRLRRVCGALLPLLPDCVSAHALSSFYVVVINVGQAWFVFNFTLIMGHQLHEEGKCF